MSECPSRLGMVAHTLRETPMLPRVSSGEALNIFLIKAPAEECLLPPSFIPRLEIELRICSSDANDGGDQGDGNDNDGLKSASNDPGASTTDRETQFWKKYSKEADDHDKDFLLKNGNNIEGVLIFSGLFSAVSASFLVSMQADLKPDPTETTNALLMMLVHSSNNSAFGNQALGIPTWNGPSSAVLCSQVLGYAALSASLLAALGAVLGKQWLSDFTRLRSGPLQERGRRRQQKLDGLKRWRFEVFMGTLPALIQIALLLFSISLAINLWELNHGVGSMVFVATAIGVSFYFFITLASLLSPTCPFHTPVSSTIRAVMRVAMKLVEEIAEYWAWRSNNHNARRPTIGRVHRILAHITAILVSLLLTVTSAILLPTLATLSPVFVFVAWIQGGIVLLQTKAEFYYSALQSKTLRGRFHESMCSIRDSARSTLDLMSRDLLDPGPDSDPRSIAWLLETSTDPDTLMAAAELVPDAKWPDELDISLPTEHLCGMFIRSIPENGSTNERALRLGKAFVIMLCQMSNDAIPRVWQPALERVTASVNPDIDPDLRFILTIVVKLLSHRLGLESRAEFPPTLEVSQPLLAWLLQPLETLLRLDHPCRPCFLPEAYRVFLKLRWPEESKLDSIQEMQYCRTFETYFNGVMSTSFGQTVEASNENLQEWSKVPADCLKRILEKLKNIDPTRLPEVHQHLIVPLTVFSRLASIFQFKQVIRDASINSWMLAAFKGAVSKADESGKTAWLFASCLIQLATGIDAFNSTGGQVEKSSKNAGESKRTPSPPLRVDSQSLLSYLLNKETPATSEQVVYALQILLANVDEHSMLASNPQFVNYVLYATGPGQVYSIRDIGLKVLVAACQALLRAYDTVSLVTLAANCDLVRFLHRAILNQDPPTMLKEILRIGNEDLNDKLLGILAPALGDPFNALLTKLRDEANKIPERDLRDLEIALVLSGNEGRKKLLFDHLDHCIAMMPLWDYQYAMALPLTVIVGWLLRRDGPVSSSESVWRAFLRPSFELLLFPAWGDSDVLEDNPQMLRLLLDCTARWLSTYSDAGTSSPSPSDATLTRLQHALDQLRSGNRALSADIKRALQRLSREIKRHGQV